MEYMNPTSQMISLIYGCLALSLVNSIEKFKKEDSLYIRKLKTVKQFFV